MKLGDLDALKTALDEKMNFDENCRDSVFNIIDNAPIVDAYTIEDVRDLIGLLEKRPQGETINKVKAIIDEYYLNVADKDSTDIKAYLFDKILDVFANDEEVL